MNFDMSTACRSTNVRCYSASLHQLVSISGVRGFCFLQKLCTSRHITESALAGGHATGPFLPIHLPGSFTFKAKLSGDTSSLE